MNGRKPTYKKPNDLPIYKAAMYILDTVDSIHDDFKRDRRHTIWQQLSNYADRLPMFICIANDFPAHRADAIMLMLSTVAIMQAKLEHCKIREYISTESYLKFAKPFSSIERQANGWLQSTLKAGAGDDDTGSADYIKGGSPLASHLLDELRIS